MALKTLDIVLLILSLLASAAIGIYHGIIGLNQTSMDYLLGGRKMKPLPLALSLTVGTVSAITIMGNAGEMYAHGTQLWVMDLGVGFGMYFVAKYFIPIFYPLKMVSIYQYIESRFKSVWLRRATVVLTLGGAYLFIGFLLFPPSMFLTSFTGLSINTNIVITGLACSLYSSFGGVKAVVYTDVLQSLIMIAGSLAIVIQGSLQVGGIGQVWDIAYHHDRIEFLNFDLDPFQRHSFWLVIIYGFFFSLSTYGVNQSQTQRAFSTSSMRESQKVIYYAIVGMFLLRGLMNLSGIVIFANYADCDPLTMNNNKSLNIVIVIKYVTQYLTKIPGLAGLFVASIYAAVLSSVSTQVNSMTALIWEDFLKEISIFKKWSEVNITRLQKVLVMITGIFGIFASLLASKFSSFLKGLLQITGAVWGPMVGLFLVALYLPWVKVKGASLGFVVAIIISTWIVAGQIFTQPEAVFLPMSYEGCPISLSTQNNTDDVTKLNSTETFLTMNKTIDHPKLNRGIGFYGISYCLNHCWGVFICIIVSLLFTTFTSPNSPSEMDEKLIHPLMWEVFTKGIKRSIKDYFRKLLTKKGSSSIDEEREAYKTEEEMEPMGKSL